MFCYHVEPKQPCPVLDALVISYLQEFYLIHPLNQEHVPEDQLLQEIHKSKITTL